MTTEAQVLAVLQRAKPRAVTINDLRLATRTSRRDVEAAIEWLRLQGHPLIGGTEGVRLTDKAEEVQKYLEARRRRMASIYLGSRALRTTLRRLKEAQDAEAGLTLFGTAA